MDKQRVIIIGAGFAGLYAARKLAGTETDVLLIDRQNFHTFTPLLYQVATCGLDPSEIAYPVRSIFSHTENIQFMLGEVKQIAPEAKQLVVQTNGQEQTQTYDYLIIAAGSVTNFFQNTSVEQYALGLKDLQEAVSLRHHILQLFEKADWVTDPAERKALTTMVVVGGGPTGIETAGALHELYQHVLLKEYHGIQPDEAQVILVEATDRLLAPYPDNLQAAARKQLESLGVEVILNDAVAEMETNRVLLRSGREIRTHTLIWAAGVQASPIAKLLGTRLERGGRVPVDRTMALAEYPDIYVVGDMAYLEDEAGKPYPMVIPVAKQQGLLAAENILRRIRSQTQHDFVYHDRGMMATIGRSRAVAFLYNRLPLSGYLAWLAWLGLHLLWLMGFRNRLNVLVNWVWNYLTYDRSVRIILYKKE